MAGPNARFISRATINGEKTEMSQHWIVLNDSAPGTCQITINTEPQRLQQVQVDLGWGDMVYRVFSGFIERYQKTADGWFTAFCREYSAVLEKEVSVMLRHATMRQVVDEIANQTGLAFTLPNAAYVDKAIPCFYAHSTGLAMLQQIGRSFQIADFVWYQQANGDIYLGSYANSFWQGKAPNIPVGLMTDHQAARSATMTAAPLIRPHVTLNGERLKRVEFKATEMTLEW
ncbi:hypothetical protein [Shewanella sp.]|uniref:hypothetical protein n=1 Tax=Shewanella sp. TaxID=50422 RepID=UPI003A986499